MSQLLVDDIVNKDDTGSPGFSRGAIITGVTTSTGFDGSGADLTSLPAAQLTGTLPAISGANLTSLPDKDIIIEGNTKAEVVDTGSDGHFKVETEGSERLRILSNGLIGIGTDNPDNYNPYADDLVICGTGHQGLTIRSGASHDGSIMFNDTDDANQRGIVRYLHTDDSMAFHTSGGEALRIDSNGNVGINTTPGTLLELNGQSSKEADITFNREPVQGTNDGVIGQLIFENATDSVAQISVKRESAADDAYIQFANQATSGGLTERLRITSAGYVGIKESNPAGLLQVGPTSGSYVLLNEGTGVTINDGKCDVYTATTNAASEPIRVQSDIGGTKTKVAAIRADGSSFQLSNFDIGNNGGSSSNTGHWMQPNGEHWQFIDNSTSYKAYQLFNTSSEVASISKDGDAAFAGITKIGDPDGNSYTQGIIISPTGGGQGSYLQQYCETGQGNFPISVYNGTTNTNNFYVKETGETIVGNDADNGANAGIRLWYGGAIAACRSSGSTAVFSGYTQGNATPQIGIYANGNITSYGVISDSIGQLRRLGQNIQSGNYTLVASDAGKHIRVDGAHTIEVPDNVFTAGDMITIVANSASDVPITQGSGLTLYNASDGTTGSKTQAARTVSTILFAEGGSGAKAYISGGGLS